MSISLATDELMPFPGYRQPRFDSRTGFETQRPELVPTIEHFFQSERFRGTDEALRRAILDANSAKEARKLAERHAELERPNWAQLQERVMETAIWMKYREHPRYAKHLLKHPEAADDAYRFQDHYWGGHREGVSQNRYRAVLLKVRERLQQEMVRVTITGSSTFNNAFLLSGKLQMLFRRTPPDVIFIGCRKGADDLAERWAIEQALPVRHIPFHGRRNRTERERHARALISRATHLVAFSDGDADTDLLAGLAREQGCAIRVLPISARPTPPPQMRPGIPQRGQPPRPRRR